MPHVRAPDLTVAFDGDRLLIRAVPRGLGARVPPLAIAVLSFCGIPRTEDEVAAALGPVAARLFSDLVGAGLLVDPADPPETTAFFEGFGRIDVHRRMLGDAVRLQAYADAIAAAVEPGMVVVDAGTGTGVLAVLAARAGARVVAIDRTDVVAIAREVVAASGVADRVTVLQGDFSRIALPEPADLVVTETFGALAYAEGAAADLAAGCSRWLRPGGRVLPGAVSLAFAPLSAAGVAPAVAPFDTRHPVDLTPLVDLARTRGATLPVAPDTLLAPGASLPPAPFPDTHTVAGTLDFDVHGEVHGLAGWFRLHFDGRRHLSTAPDAPATHWAQVVLPWAPVQVDGRLEVVLDIQPDPADRRGIEITTTWRAGSQTGRTAHKVR